MKEKNNDIEQIIKNLEEQEILEAVGDGISIQDTDFKVLYQNQVHKSLIGNHLGEYCYEAYEQREKTCEGCPLAMVFDDGKIHATERSAPTDKGMVHVEITASPLKDSTGKIIAGVEVVRDIMERKHTQEALLESENEFRSLAEKSLVGIYLFRDGVFKYVNPKLAEIFGYTVEELIDKKGPQDLALPEDWLIVKENIRRRISGEIEAVNYSVRGIKKNKDIIYIEVYGSRTIYQGQPAVIGTLLDITERKKMEKEVKERIEELEKFYEMAIGRELRMKELKDEIKRLQIELAKYQK